MSRIDKIKNLSVFNDLTHTPMVWDFNTNLHFVADEVVIRQLSYQGPITDNGLFMIWCSLTNDYIASFAISDISTTSSFVNITPNTRIQCLPNSINQSLQFQVHTVSGQNTAVSSNSLTGQIVINMDFISYKK
jgi:hypothetical protein